MYAEAEDLNLPLETAQAGPHKGTLPKELSFLQVSGGTLQVTAFKRAEDHEDSFVLRVFNPSDKPVEGTISVFKPIKKAWLTNLNEERETALKPVGKTLKVKLGKKKIATIEFAL